MKKANLLVAGAISALTMTYAFQASALCWEDCPPPPEECLTDCEPEGKGNNGWGNGLDPTNNGSFSGATAVTKDNNGQNQPRLGPKPAVHEKFDGR